MLRRPPGRQARRAAGPPRSHRRRWLDRAPKSSWTVTDTDIAKEVERALKWVSNVPETIQAEIVDHRRDTLIGEVRWDFQRQAAKRALQYSTCAASTRRRSS